jgi:hypothetical protein
MRCGHQQLPFAHVVRARLFNIHVLARGERQQGHRHVPMVWRGYRYSIDRRVIQHAAKVADAFSAARFAHRSCQAL